MSSRLDNLRAAFRNAYANSAEVRLFRAPGRVNLIGEHTDYNDGFVLPLAIDRDTIVAAAPRDDRRVRVLSLNVNEQEEFDLDHPGQRQRGLWLDYVEGIAQMLSESGAKLRGADLALESDVPSGAGLSSSAALEMSVGLALLSLSNVEVERVALALAGQKTEHLYVGTQSGIMDQLVVLNGRKGNALLIDCRSLETTQIPLDTSNTVVVICDTHVKHSLASSAYNTRRAECEEGVRLLREVLPDVRALRDVSFEDFEKHQDRLPDTIKRRCRHIITENARTLDAASALRSSDINEVGRLMFESHESLRDDYEVSCVELDRLVEIAAGVEGVTGARMTGGGFGGCTVNLVQRDTLATFNEKVAREYAETVNNNLSIYVAEASDGAQEIELGINSVA